MEMDPPVSDWIKREDEAEAQRAKAKLFRRVPGVRDLPMLNLIEASAYPLLHFTLPLTSPVPQAAITRLNLARAPTPTNHAVMDPFEDPCHAMDCSEDVERGIDCRVDPPSTSPFTLFTQHTGDFTQELHTQCGEAGGQPDPMLIGDPAQQLGTLHHCFTRGASGPQDVTIDTARMTSRGLAVRAPLDSPMGREGSNPPLMGQTSQGGYMACEHGNADTPLTPMLTPHALPDEWLDVYTALLAFPRPLPLEMIATHPSNILGCGNFSECIERSRAHAIKVDIPAIESTARSLLNDGKGVDHSMMDGHISAIRAQGMGQALECMSAQTLPTTLHPRPHLISDPPERHPPLPVQQHPTCRVTLSALQQATLEAHCDRIAPPPSPRSSSANCVDDGNPVHPGSVHNDNDI